MNELYWEMFQPSSPPCRKHRATKIWETLEPAACGSCRNTHTQGYHTTHTHEHNNNQHHRTHTWTRHINTAMITHNQHTKHTHNQHDYPSINTPEHKTRDHDVTPHPTNKRKTHSQHRQAHTEITFKHATWITAASKELRVKKETWLLPFQPHCKCKRTSQRQLDWHHIPPLPPRESLYTGCKMYQSTP